MKILYRSGPERSIKIFNPRIVDKSHDPTFKRFPLIYASDDKSYAAAFCFDWDDQEGFRLGRTNNDPWTLTIPIKFQNRLLSNCSLYEIDGTSFTKIISLSTPEWSSKRPAKVLKEYKYNSALQCLKENSVRLKYK